MDDDGQDDLLRKIDDIGQRVARIDRDLIRFEAMRFQMIALLVDGLIDAGAIRKARAIDAVTRGRSLAAGAVIAGTENPHTAALLAMVDDFIAYLRQLP